MCLITEHVVYKQKASKQSEYNFTSRIPTWRCKVNSKQLLAYFLNFYL